MHIEFKRDADAEKISAFIDGEEPKISFDKLCSQEGQEVWRTYLMIDQLVKDPSMKCLDTLEFVASVHDRIAKEPKAFVPRHVWLKRAVGAFATAFVVGGIMYFAWPERDSLNDRIVASTERASDEAIKRQQQDYQEYLKEHYQAVGSNPNAFDG
ncbi:RseA family anti-sigma factor [Basilea psittacipulmonis]|uniref:Anti sigma-E protein RseA N-terminal domain-containing protein n=1 Tax=Basilea psittacipulmonis DSM 24701 TaxID=1072685 RepID=A0A077DEU5_9BURK|nr:RseA family anti-sigma factor [Basilea psittacipulmonis]AIL33244.1 hypothetical protein IX83_08000 [Basilea psittacipulmonis DSM 24701]